MASRQLPPMQTSTNRHEGGSNPSSTVSHTHTPTGGQRRTTPKPLNFQNAMRDFHGMFPELDRDVIETVLRANNGVVQTTIDQLLQLQESTIMEKAQIGPVLPSYESSIGEGEEPPPAYNDIWEDVGPPLPDPLFPIPKNVPSIAPSIVNASPPPDSFPRNTLWNAPLVGKLPHDFLRIDNTQPPINSTTTSTTRKTVSGGKTGVFANKENDKDFMTDDDVERFLEDEKLAIFLQNEEFLRELRRNREFVSSLEQGNIKNNVMLVWVRTVSISMQ